MSQGLDMWSVVLLLVSIFGLVQGLSRIDPLVSTKGGLIRGLQSDHGFAKFLGVPYGVVDENNPFGPAVPHPGFDYIFEAYESNVCPQVNNGDDAIGTINCLTMNIYVPNIADSRVRLPVMVWIHGGAFVHGSADEEGGHSNFLLQNDVIVVAINYRLGVFGFMCLDIPEVPGNQGLKDQVLALRWINENIEAFGGDARQITVFGESAGGMSTNLHLLSSYGNLFQKAIIQSGPAISPWVMVKSDSTIPLRLAEALGFITEDVSEALTYISSANIHLLAKLSHDLKIIGSVGTHQPLTKPCVEKTFEGVENFITEHPGNIKSAKARNIPVMIGNNNNEIAFEYENLDAEFFRNYNIDSVLSMAMDLNDNLEDVVDDIRHYYVGDEKMSEKLKCDITDFASDFIFNHPTQRMAEQFLYNDVQTVYRYLFSYSGGRNMMTVPMNLNSTGAAHADELGYLFDLEMFSGEITPEDQLMVDRITTLWTNFAKYGNPTPETSELLPVKWEPITKTTQPYLDINSDLDLKARPFHDRMAFWISFIDSMELIKHGLKTKANEITRERLRICFGHSIISIYHYLFVISFNYRKENA